MKHYLIIFTLPGRRVQEALYKIIYPITRPINHTVIITYSTSNPFGYRRERRYLKVKKITNHVT